MYFHNVSGGSHLLHRTLQPEFKYAYEFSQPKGSSNRRFQISFGSQVLPLFPKTQAGELLGTMYVAMQLK